MTTVACLVCTNRPDWEPWYRHQIGKQHREGMAVLPLAESGDESIAVKRTRLLSRAFLSGAEFVAWFDDDDWSSHRRLDTAIGWLSAEPGVDAVGNVASYFVSTREFLPGVQAEPGVLQQWKAHRPIGAVRYQAPEGIIFNGAVFRTSSIHREFNHALSTGEDTEWLGRWLKTKPNYLILGEPMHLWLCHEKNTTNRANTRAFDQRLPSGLITEEEWKLVPS